MILVISFQIQMVLADHRQRHYSCPRFTNKNTRTRILGAMIAVLIQYPIQMGHISPIIISISANINLTLNITLGSV